jgi:hypothetical protein
MPLLFNFKEIYMDNIINELKIILKKIYIFDVNLATKHNLLNSRLVKSKLDKMRRECEML